MFDIALGIFLFLSPIFLLPKPIGNLNALQFYQFGVIGMTGYNYLQLQFFQFGTIVLFIIALLSKQQRQFKNVGVVLLLALLCLVTFWHPISIKLFWNVLCGFILFYLVVVYTKNYKKLLWVIVVISLLNTIFALLQNFGINLIYNPTGRNDGLMCLSTHLGVYQAMVLPICYSINPWLALIPLTGALLSKSIWAILLSLLGMGYCFKRKIINQGFPMLVLCFSILTLFIVKNLHTIIYKLIEVRMVVWKQAIEIISKNLIWGNGIKPFSYSSTIGLFENTNSIYLQLFYYVGILAVIPLFFIIRNLFGKSDFIILSSVVIALLVGIEKSFLDYPRLAGTFIILYAFLTISKGETNGIS